MTDDDGWLVPTNRDVLTGDERFVGIDSSVRDFWRFALGDLRMNNARGYLAEFIVGTILGIGDIRRTEWDAYDLLWNEITIEVKSSAYLQAWPQRRLSTIRFGGLKGTRWDPRHDYDPAGRRHNAMVYVFCVQTAQDHLSYEPLDLVQWEFYVVPRTKLSRLGQESIGIARVRELSGGETPWAGLKSAVAEAARGEHRADDDSIWW